ncbi:MAG: hypothetical protein M1817_006283 [Caeruleum heppii]|nr:MAG: hypothetical protein M1817_006283 [Caeruleum heppii]
MAPPRTRPVPDDTRSETSSTRERQPATGQGAVGGRERRNGGAGLSAGSSLKDVTAAGAAASTNITGNGSTEGSGGINWSSLDASILHRYRHAYRLNSPAAFSQSFNQTILTNSGIGKHSPTMARARDRRRVGKEQLALAVRKNFNGLGIQEGEVVVDFLYKVRWQDKHFRMRFTPSIPKAGLS